MHGKSNTTYTQAFNITFFSEMLTFLHSNGDSGGPVVGYDEGDPILLAVESIGLGCGNRPGISVRTSGHAAWMRSVGVPFTKYHSDLPKLGPECSPGERLMLRLGEVSTCVPCPPDGYSKPPTRLCVRCPSSTLRDTRKGRKCSCRAVVGSG